MPSDSQQKSILIKERNKNVFSVFDIILNLAQQIKIIIITPVITCLLMIVYLMFFAEPIFTSTSKIVSSSNSAGSSKAMGLAAQFGVNLPTGKSEPNWVYPAILKSRTLAEKVIKRKFNTNEYGQEKSLSQILLFDDDKESFDQNTLNSLAINKFLEMTNISEDKKTMILTIGVNASEASLAAEINAALIQELDQHQHEYNIERANKTKLFIEDRIVDVGGELKVAEDVLREFTTRNRRIDNSPLLQLEQQRLSREVMVLTDVFTTLKQQLETTKIEAVKESDYVVVIDHPYVPIQRSKPKKKLMVIASGLIGIFLGLFIAIIRDIGNYLESKEKSKIDSAKNALKNNLVELVKGVL
tara:strand:+ start:3538 stop:4608 length:1071 start_codon:yes stop_codon:yes gene_type:complete